MKLRKIALLTALFASPVTAIADHSAEDIIANDRVETMCSLSGSIVNELVTLRADNPDRFYDLIGNHKGVSADDINKQYIVDPFLHLGLWVDGFDAKTASADIGLSYKKMCAEDNLFI
jgi:hypothetical protein